MNAPGKNCKGDTHHAPGQLKREPGTYVLVLECTRRRALQIGRWGQLELDHGHYLYVGSALGAGGLRARVSRHCRRDKTRRWHVDFLRACTRLDRVWYLQDAKRLEHVWAKALEGVAQATPVKGFGCSDCHCLSHLFFVADEAGLTACAHALPQGVLHGTCRDADHRHAKVRA